MKIEIELPEIEGFEYTGEFRKPKDGEYFKADVLGVQKGNGVKVNRLILRKIETMEGRIKAEYPDYEVEMLDICKCNGWLGISEHDGAREPHIHAQSYPRFSGYIYHSEHGHLFSNPSSNYRRALGGEMFMPIAVLFTKDSK